MYNIKDMMVAAIMALFERRPFW